jgi:hypothetical protein
MREQIVGTDTSLSTPQNTLDLSLPEKGLEIDSDAETLPPPP